VIDSHQSPPARALAHPTWPECFKLRRSILLWVNGEEPQGEMPEQVDVFVSDGNADFSDAGRVERQGGENVNQRTWGTGCNSDSRIASQ
jgi:hypothetical protein